MPPPKKRVTMKLNGATFVAYNRRIIGNGNTIVGRDNLIIGDDNNITGSNNDIVGDNNELLGSCERVTGNNNSVYGTCVTFCGDNNKFTGWCGGGVGHNNLTRSEAKRDHPFVAFDLSLVKRTRFQVGLGAEDDEDFPQDQDDLAFFKAVKDRLAKLLEEQNDQGEFPEERKREGDRIAKLLEDREKDPKGNGK